uniref:Translocation protein SEC62 n=1 Tax=Plectus sambesii TaxID=2011161 RepID=A0A914VZN2_9BILA
MFIIACNAAHDFLCDLTSSKAFFLSLLIFAIITFPYLPLWSRGAAFVTCTIGVVCISALLSIHLLRLASFAVFWSLTLGKHHFWWLPNLTADCCFSDSFKPLYSHETGNFWLFGKPLPSAESKINSQTAHSQQAEHDNKDRELGDGKKTHLD